MTTRCNLILQLPAALTKIKGLGPDALDCGGSSLSGIKVVKQSHDILPKIVKGGIYGASPPQTA